MIIKGLLPKGPWASLITSGRKTIETRVWCTNTGGRC
ncbi:TPA: hypothetical protein DCE37_19505 [Candidatus Latescibacteria bacterium]|nr:hypothetical protein [Candidatus Latescibacterota bacterium]